MNSERNKTENGEEGISSRALLMGGRAQTSGLGKGERTWSCQERIVKDVPLRESRDSFFFALLSPKGAVIVQLTKLRSPTQKEHVMKALREGAVTTLCVHVHM